MFNFRTLFFVIIFLFSFRCLVVQTLEPAERMGTTEDPNSGGSDVAVSRHRDSRPVITNYEEIILYKRNSSYPLPSVFGSNSKFQSFLLQAQVQEIVWPEIPQASVPQVLVSIIRNLEPVVKSEPLEYSKWKIKSLLKIKKCMKSQNATRSRI